jgi:hypothetical protein
MIYVTPVKYVLFGLRLEEKSESYIIQDKLHLELEEFNLKPQETQTEDG